MKDNIEKMEELKYQVVNVLKVEGLDTAEPIVYEKSS